MHQISITLMLWQGKGSATYSSTVIVIMKPIRIPLLGRIIIAIALGVALGGFLPEAVVRVFSTFNAIFGELLGFAIPLIIVGLVTVAIADMGRNAGRMLLLTVALAYGATLFSGLLALGTSYLTFPSLIEVGSVDPKTFEAGSVNPYFSISIPPLMGVMTALVLAFVLGMGLSQRSVESPLRGAAKDFEAIVSGLIQSVIIPLLPLYIFGIFLGMTYTGQVYSILMVFLKVVGIIFAVHILLLLIQFGVAGAIAGRNPLRLLGTMLPAYFTALGTQSSAATIPVTLEQAKKNGVSPEVAGFVIPLCATIHLSGSTLKIVSCAMALMLMLGMPIDPWLMLGFICMLGITMIAAPGVPGGAIMACLGLLQSMLGFDEGAQALMIALYIAMDSFGTACNVTGDGALAVIVERIVKLRHSA